MQSFNWTYNEQNFSGITWHPEYFYEVIVIVHGIGEHVGRYEHLGHYFSDRGYAVIGIDHYGHGRSAGARGASKGFEFYFDYLSAFLGHVKTLYNKPIILYGHSMGGGIVTGFLLKRQPHVKAAIISSPALLIARKVNPVLHFILKCLNAIIPNFRVSQGLDVNKISHDKKVVEDFKNDKLNHDKMSITLALGMIENGAWCLENADKLQVPSLLIHGDKDEFTDVRGSRLFAERAPKNLLLYKEWPGGYHELHNEPFKEDVLYFIAEWLKTH